MILNNQILDMIKAKSGLDFDKAKDYDALCDCIFTETKRTIGVNTIKRLMGYIIDDRKTNEYTLNTIAIYLSFASWEELCGSIRIDSDWGFDDQTLYVEDFPINQEITVKYLNRTVTFMVVLFHSKKMLKVLKVLNSSLAVGDILDVDHLRIGDFLEAKKVYRGSSIGNYKTNGELKDVQII